jgi:hypothetical protein
MTFCLHDLHCTCLQQVVLLLYINNSSILRYIFIINSSSFLSARLFNLALEALLIIVFVLAQLRSRPRHRDIHIAYCHQFGHGVSSGLVAV